jgi:hypothetical protein
LLSGERDFSLLHNVQTGSWAHPASYVFFIWELSDKNVKLITHFHLELRSRMTEIYLHSRIRLRDVVFN